MRILLVGGTGFLGAAIARRLAATVVSPPELILPTRRPMRARDLSVLPSARVIAADVHDEATLARLMAGCDAVISLVGILHGGEGQPYGAGFARAHVALPRLIGKVAARLGVRRVVHVSALAADADAPSGYLRSKAAGENALREAGCDLTILRPSVIFGRGDSFLTLFAGLAGVAPFFPLAGANARFAPVWAEDVAAIAVECLARPDSIGKALPLCGPREYALRELVSLAARLSGHPRPVVPLPAAVAWMQALAMERLPVPPMTRDNLRSMRVPSVCPAGSTLPFGRVAMPLETVAPGYLSPPRSV